MIKKIEVNDRQNINFFSSFIYNEPHIIISINSVGCGKVDFSPCKHRKDILFLQFDDTHFNDWRLNDAVHCKSFLDGLKESKDKLNSHEKEVAENLILRLFNEDQAKEIKNFVDKYKDEVDMIVSQCHAGISRSSAVAAALADYLKVGDSNDYFENNKYCPNYYVYGVLKIILAGKEIEKLNLNHCELV